MFPEFFNSIPRPFLGCSVGIEMLFHGCFKEVSRVFQGSFKDVSRKV